MAKPPKNGVRKVVFLTGTLLKMDANFPEGVSPNDFKTM